MSDNTPTDAQVTSTESLAPPAAAPAPAKSPLASWALVLGIVTVVFAIIPGLSFVAGLPGFAALGLGLVALLKRMPRMGRSITGMALGGAGIFLALVVSVGFIVSLAPASVSAEQTSPSPAQVLSDEEIAAADAAAAAEAEARAAEEEAQAAAEAEEAAERAAAEAAAEEAARGTVAQQNALRSAESYLNFTAFSYSGLIGQLEYEGYSTEDATWAVDRVGADWNEQAALSAASYLEFSSFSRSGLIDQLIFEGFTRAQAEYGVDQTGL